MSDAYAFDANIVINLNRHTPRDIYPTVWQRVEDLIASGRCGTPRQVYDELERVDDYCAPWAKLQPGFVVEATEAEIALVAQIAVDHPAWVQEQVNEADPWLIAHAAARGRILVTAERRKGPGSPDSKLKIPNVADEHTVTCVSFNEVARREGWVF